MHYALELAQRGYITLSPDYPSFGEYAYDFDADDYTSGSQAALVGGITSLGNMSYVLPWESIADRVRAEEILVAR